MAVMRRQPHGRVEINRANSLKQGLIFLSSDLFSPVAATGQAQTQISPATLVRGVDPNGRTVAVNAYGSGGAVSLPASVHDALVGSPYTIAWICGPIQAAAAGQLLYGNRNDSQGASVFTLVIQPGQIAVSNSSASIIFNRSSITQGGRMSLSVNVATATLRNSGGTAGPGVGSVANTIGLPAATSILPYVLNKGDGGRGFLSGVSAFAIWNRDLTALEQAQWEANPWQLFAAADDDDYSAATSLSAYTLSAASGSFAMTAAAAGVYVGRKLQAGQGSFALATMPAGMKVARRLQADTASFAMTGRPASILSARKLAANVGTFGLAGTAAPLSVMRRLAAQPAAFVLQAGAAQMVYTPAQGPVGPTYVLGAAAGSFSLSGGAAQLRFNRILRAAPASMLLAGADAKLRAARALRVDSANFTVAGSAVVLKYSGTAGPIDISKISPARIVVFEGSGSRLVPFEGSGSRVVPFEGSGSRVVVFEGSGSKTVRFE